MKVIRDGIELCADCMMFAVNGDVTGIAFSCSDEDDAENRIRDIMEGVGQFGPHLVPDFDTDTGDGYEEFSSRGCDACRENANKGGSLYRFAVLGPDDRDGETIQLTCAKCKRSCDVVVPYHVSRVDESLASFCCDDCCADAEVERRDPRAKDRRVGTLDD